MAARLREGRREASEIERGRREASEIERGRREANYICIKEAKYTYTKRICIKISQIYK